MKQKFTLFDGEHSPDTITIEGEHVGFWNGMAVPRVTARDLIDYWSRARQADPNGEWYAVPFVDNEGSLRIQSFNDPDDRDDDYVYARNDDGTYDIEGLVWSIVEAAEQNWRTFTMGLPVEVAIKDGGTVHLSVYAADMVGNLEDNGATSAEVALAGRALMAGMLTSSVSAR